MTISKNNHEREFINKNSIFYQHEKRRLLSLIFIFLFLSILTFGAFFFFFKVKEFKFIFYLPFLILGFFFFILNIKNIFLIFSLFKKKYDEATKTFDLSIYYRWVKKNQLFSIYLWIYVFFFMMISLAYNIYFSLNKIESHIQTNVIVSLLLIFVISVFAFFIFKRNLSRDIVQGKLFFGSKIFRIEVEIVKKLAIKELINFFLTILYCLTIIPIIITMFSTKAKKKLYV